MKTAKSILILVIAALMPVAVYFMTGTEPEREFVKRKAELYAREYLAEPDTRKFNVVGERSYLSGCAKPEIQVEYLSYEKRRYEFKISCAGAKVGYVLVSMRADPPSFISVNRESGWVKADKAP